MKKASSSNCHICGVKEDIQHFLVECVGNEEKRKEVIIKNNFNLNFVGIPYFSKCIGDSNVKSSQDNL